MVCMAVLLCLILKIRFLALVTLCENSSEIESPVCEAVMCGESVCSVSVSAE